MENPILVGAIAPVFNVKDNLGNMVNLNDLRGKNVLLSWHPLAFTPVCTEQMKSIEANYTRFTELNTIPFGFSVDPAP